MRLGQLSRKLNIPTTEIGAIIADEFKVTIGEHPNIKLDDEHAEFIIGKFEKTESESSDPNPDVEKTGNEEIDQPLITEEENENVVENEIPFEASTEEKEEIETIRVKAAKLEGLTVVDKIELPEPPPPEMVDIDGVMYDKAELKKQRIAERKEREAKKRKESARKAIERKLERNKSPNKSKKELSLAEKRSIEEMQDQDRKNQEERRKRYRQKKHYESKHKMLKPDGIKTENKEEEVKVETKEVLIETRPEAKTLLGKFWRWLNTY